MNIDLTTAKYMKQICDHKNIDLYFSTVAILLATVFGSILLFSLAGSVEAAADQTIAQLDTMNYVSERSGLVTAGSTGSEPPLTQFLGKILNPLLGVAGSLFFVLIVYAGLLWSTAAGNEERVGKAKKILSTAFVGLVLTIMAYAITSLVINNLLKATQPSASGNWACVYYNPGANDCGEDTSCVVMSGEECATSYAGSFRIGEDCTTACP